jgi:hypothetical protein
MPAPPRVFISHASEDKTSFAKPLGERLLATGIDAWVDEWEMLPGDSLPRKVFEEGIGSSDIVVIGLSTVSVRKPWVREEIDTATVQRIEGRCRIVPVTLEPNVQIPVALSHLLRCSIPSDGLDGVADELVRLCYGQSRKPPLNGPPPYSHHIVTRVALDDPVDDLVFDAVVELLRRWGLNSVMMSDEAMESVANAGVSKAAFQESMHSLTRRNLLDATAMAGGERWWIRGVSTRVWLEEEEKAGVDIRSAKNEILAAAVNREDLHAFLTRLNERTIDAILQELQSQRLLSYSRVVSGGGGFVVVNVSPLARRLLRGT